MPVKRASKSKDSLPVTRTRSKSVGRSAKNSSQTQSRSRSRSRSRGSTTKRNRTPASESKVRRLRSTSSSRSPSPNVISHETYAESKSATLGTNKHNRTTTIPRETTPSRFSQRIIQKIEMNVVHDTVNNSTVKPNVQAQFTGYPGRYETLFARFRSTICNSPFTAFICLVTFVPLAYWLNLIVFAPSTAEAGKSETLTRWGPAYPFAGVLWPTDLRLYLDYRCHLFVFFYLFTHFLIARFLPYGFKFGSYVDSHCAKHRYNGLFTLSFCIGLYCLAQFSNWLPFLPLRPTALLQNYWLRLFAATSNIAVIFSLMAYIASRRISRSESNNGNFFVDLWRGRCSRPHWFGLDWKMTILRPGLVGFLLVECTYLVSQWDQFGRISPALASVVFMHSLWVLDFFIFEHAMLHSYEVRYEGFGFFYVVGNLMMPFTYSIGASYLSSRPDVGRLFMADKSLDPFQCALFVAAFVLFFAGYWIYRSSNNQKHLFRSQPNDPSFNKLAKISGPHSQRLLAGGWWGVVRHPNYLGDLMMAYAQSLTTGFVSPITWFYPLFLTIFFVHRILHTEHLNDLKYGTSMNVYKRLVSWRLIRKIF